MYHVSVVKEGDVLVLHRPDGVFVVYSLHHDHPVYVGKDDEPARHSVGMSTEEWESLFDSPCFALADDLFCTGMPAYCNADCPLPRRNP